MKAFVHRKKGMSCILIILFLSANNLFAATINVPSDRLTLTDAVSAAKSGDVIILAPGTYKQTRKILITKQLTITSQWYKTGDKKFISQTILDGVDKGNTLFETEHQEGVDVEISGLTITRFSYPIIINDAAVIQHNIMSNNAKDAISFERTGYGYVGYNTIEDSRDDAIDIDSREGHFTIEFNDIRNSGDDGMEIRLFSSSQPGMTYDIHDNTFNGSDEDGIQLIDHTSDDSGREFYIYNNVFDSNAMAGIGLMSDGKTDENYKGSPMLERVLFYNNTVINNTIGMTGGYNFIALNNIIANNTKIGVKRFRRDSVVAHSIFSNNGTNIYDAITDKGIILNKDPEYDPLTYQLLADSRSIDSGVASFIWNGELVLDQNASEYVGSAPDLGAKEFDDGTSVENIGPTVNAGMDQVVFEPNDSITLAGAVSDDGLPRSQQTVSSWTQDDGPGTIIFNDANDLSAEAFFSQQGKYHLRLIGDDGELTASDSMLVRYASAGNGNIVAMKTPGTTYFEAEDYAYLYGTAERISDADASRLVAIKAQEGLGAEAFTEHTLTVTDQEVTFYVWILGKGKDQNSNTVFVSLANSPEVEVTLPASNSYDWVKMPGSFNRTAGNWPLIIRAGEYGVSWDRLVFTTDSAFVPDGNNNSNTLDIRVSSSADDAEELASSGSVEVGSSDLELVNEGSTPKQQLVGMRFNNISIPEGSIITKAYIQFQVDEVNLELTSLMIEGEDTDNALTFNTARNNISNRARTLSSIVWEPEQWTKVGEAGFEQQTSDISTVIQEIINRPGWLSGHSLAIIITGSGERTAESFDGKSAAAPLLHIEYENIVNSENQQPSVNAGVDQTITLGNTVTLKGTVSDDGLPNGSLASTWKTVNGPDVVTFNNANSVDTTADFSLAGTYVLELVGNDGQLQSSDQVIITVNFLDNISKTLSIRVSSSSDDAEEKISSGDVSISSTDLELVDDGSVLKNQLVGLRFNKLSIPEGANITNAYIQFQADEVDLKATSLIIAGQDIDNALTFSTASQNISSRIRTLASVTWNPASWTTVAASGVEQQTSDISIVIQEIIDRSGWISGNSIALIISGSGERTAESYNGKSSAAPMLFVEYN
ncbi:MAG: PKD domain-containing protein [Methylococcaceae bacterium]